MGERGTQADSVDFIMLAATLSSMSHYHFNPQRLLRLSSSSSSASSWILLFLPK